MAYNYYNSSGNSNSSLPELTCVQFPGYGKNTDKMLEALGGIKKISEVCHDENRRMELRYRSDDQFCKPLCGERTKSTSLLLHIKYKKKKTKKIEAETKSEGQEEVNSESSNILEQGAVSTTKMSPKSCENEENSNPGTYDITQLGVVQTTYRFESMCDFQYLPVATTEEDGVKKLQNVYGELLPKGMVNSDWLDQPAPLFLPPATFSRMDTPQGYLEKNCLEFCLKQLKVILELAVIKKKPSILAFEKIETKFETVRLWDYRFKTEPVPENRASAPQNVICRTRQKRTHNAIFHSFKPQLQYFTIDLCNRV
ncbi:General transcription factor 3C polypeptide 5 [Armadillidium nasatum]|uniref:General transcription factor 3C polypeptide 5 n=1 Tax=Armadillidium nasatum TaxID=96803 RepID=A0A5N5T2D3_9CRUS|nr:General transcription factor 3C polypeptide 5 [Armadillidium nasatum]